MSHALSQDHWLPFVLPFLVYMLLGLVEPRPQPLDESSPGLDVASDRSQVPEATGSRFAIPYRYYPIYYAGRIAVTLGAMLPFLGVYRSFPRRVHVLSVAVGIAGAVIWIVLSRWRLEAALLEPLGIGGWLSSGTRPGYDPFAALGDSPLLLTVFLAVRFFGLVGVVPWIEEFFLRGFVVRCVVDPDWWKVAIGRVTPLAVAVAALYGVLSHPAEALAAGVWFSLITWLAWRTRSIWDAVAAHAVTNLLLGLYIVTYGHWALW